MNITPNNFNLLFVKEPVVLLNGIPVNGRFIFEADDVEGYIIIARTNEKGQIYADGDLIAHDRFTGKIEFRGELRK